MYIDTQTEKKNYMKVTYTYSDTGAIIEGIYKTLYFLSTYNHEEKVQP
jgi:hypothetical protein